MSLKLEPVREEFELGDDSGYHFRIIAERDPEWGWNSQVIVGGLGAHGFATSDGAVRYLCKSVIRLHNMLKEKYPDEFE